MERPVLPERSQVLTAKGQKPSKPIKLNASEIRKRLDSPGDYRTEEPGVALRVGSQKVSLSIRRRVNGRQERVSVPLNRHRLPNKVELRAMIYEAQHSEPERKASLSLQDCGERVISQSKLADRTEENYRRSLKYLVDVTGDKFPETAVDILELHRDLIPDHGEAGANSALKVLRRIVKVSRASDLPVPEWPTERLQILGMWIEEVPRTGRLNEGTLPLVWNADFGEWTQWIRFALLTAMRKNEINRTYIEGSEVRIRGLTKNGKPHRLPMTKTIRECWRDFSELPDAREITDLIQDEVGIHITPHDLRRTFKSAAREAGVSDSVADWVANHDQSDSVGNNYRGDPSDKVILDALERVEKKYLEWGAKI